jgi:CubicO group peptidase (beta-lactamase class C family)
VTSGVSGACELIDRIIRTDPRFARTSHLRVLLGEEAVFDRHYRGPAAGDVFSVTKTVLACLTGIAVGDGRIRDLDAPVGPVLGWRAPRLTGRAGATCSR